MRLGNASTTVTGTVTPASVNTRVMPHLRPTRPMVIVNPRTAGTAHGVPVRCKQAGGLGTRDPRTLGAPYKKGRPRITGVGTHALRPSKWAAEYTGIPIRFKFPPRFHPNGAQSPSGTRFRAN